MSTYSDLILGTPGLVGYWRLGESAGPTADDAFSTNDGTYTGGTFSQTGVVVGDADTAVAFDGIDDKVALPSVTFLAADSSVTIEWWQKVLTSDLSASGRTAFHFGDDVGTDRCRAHCPFTPADPTVYWDYGNSTSGQGRTQTSYSAFLDKWTHVCLLFDAASDFHAIYLDGEVRQSHTNANSPTISQVGGEIGAQTAVSEFQKGVLDEFALYNVALPASTVRLHYLAGLDSLLGPTRPLFTPALGGPGSDTLGDVR